MFDSVFGKCPNPQCRKRLEFQSKTGPCALFTFNTNAIPPEIATGINGDIVRCEYCQSNVQLTVYLKPAKAVLKLVDKPFEYRGNHNPNLPANVKERERLMKLLHIKKEEEGELNGEQCGQESPKMGARQQRKEKNGKHK